MYVKLIQRIKNNINNRVISPNLVIPNLRDSDNMGERDIFNFSKMKGWILENYDTVYLDLYYYDIYKKVYNNEINLRMINNFNFDKIDIKDISRIIEGKDKTFVFIISSYNNSQYIKKNLDSILNQTYKLWRIIYIDDHSTDETFNLVNNYIKTNNLGLVQDNHINFENESVLFLGDSFTEGQGSEAWINKFNGKFNAYQVVNGGILGTGPEHFYNLENYLSNSKIRELYSMEYNRKLIICLKFLYKMYLIYFFLP